MGEYFVIIRQVINHLAQTPSLFPSPRAHKKFFTNVLRYAKLAGCSLDILDDFKTGKDDLIEGFVERLPRDHHDIYADRLTWRNWTRNEVVLGSEDMLKAMHRNSNFALISSFLPRGGCAIAEQWRGDLNDVVNDMLQV